MNRTLPNAFLTANDVQVLTTSQIEAFSKRLDYVAEIAEKILSDLPKAIAKTELEDFLDDLELDVSVNQTLSQKYGVVTSWNMHHGWTFDISPLELRSELGDDIISAISEQAPKIDCKPEYYIKWLTIQGETLERTLNHFYSTQKFEGAVASILAMDAILANLLSGLILSRLIDFRGSNKN